MAEKSKKDNKGKTKGKNKQPSKKYAKYTKEASTLKRAQTCPKCGPGMFLGLHKNRKHCGKCGYTEFLKK